MRAPRIWQQNRFTSFNLEIFFIRWGKVTFSYRTSHAVNSLITLRQQRSASVGSQQACWPCHSTWRAKLRLPVSKLRWSWGAIVGMHTFYPSSSQDLFRYKVIPETPSRFSGIKIPSPCNLPPPHHLAHKGFLFLLVSRGDLDHHVSEFRSKHYVDLREYKGGKGKETKKETIFTKWIIPGRRDKGISWNTQ